MRHSKTRNMRASVASRFMFVAVLSALLALVSVRADVVASGDLIYGAACDASIMTYGCSGAFDSTAFDSSAFTTNYTTYGYTAANQWLVALLFPFQCHERQPRNRRVGPLFVGGYGSYNGKSGHGG